MGELRLRDVRKSFGHVEVIKGVDLEIKSGEFVVFVGPSGCGKSTLLRLIAGLEEITSGMIEFDGEEVNELPPALRGIAMVFQSYALYPHMTVYNNMAFGMKLAKASKDEIDKRVRTAAETLQLTPYLDRLPKQLSGGQRQRVAIGRAIVRNPRVFLFDEPLSNLDAMLRVQMRVEIAKLHQDLKATMIYVTHDQVEAMTLADKIVVLEAGEIRQVGSPLELYQEPANKFGTAFIGSPTMNFVSAEARSTSGLDAVLGLPGGGEMTMQTRGQLSDAAPGALELGIRPEHMLEGAGEGLSLAGTVDAVEHLGESSFVYFHLDDSTDVILRSPGDSPAEVASRFRATAPSTALHLFNADGKVIARG